MISWRISPGLSDPPFSKTLRKSVKSPEREESRAKQRPGSSSPGIDDLGLNVICCLIINLWLKVTAKCRRYWGRTRKPDRSVTEKDKGAKKRELSEINTGLRYARRNRKRAKTGVGCSGGGHETSVVVVASPKELRSSRWGGGWPRTKGSCTEPRAVRDEPRGAGAEVKGSDTEPRGLVTGPRSLGIEPRLSVTETQGAADEAKGL